MKIERHPKADEQMMVPEPVEEKPGHLTVDSTWGRIQPIVLAADVKTVGEIEVIEHIENERPLIDTRLPVFFEKSTIQGALNIPHDVIIERIDELDPGQQTVLFCNGPQCPATPDAIKRLLAANYPAKSILYYRGGIHDWITLGLPVVSPTKP